MCSLLDRSYSEQWLRILQCRGRGKRSRHDQNLQVLGLHEKNYGVSRMKGRRVAENPAAASVATPSRTNLLRTGDLVARTDRRSTPGIF